MIFAAFALIGRRNIDSHPYSNRSHCYSGHWCLRESGIGQGWFQAIEHLHKWLSNFHRRGVCSKNPRNGFVQHLLSVKSSVDLRLYCICPSGGNAASIFGFGLALFLGSYL